MMATSLFKNPDPNFKIMDVMHQSFETTAPMGLGIAGT